MNLRERSFLNYDVWGYISERFKISPKKKFDLFLVLTIIISVILEIIIQGGMANLPENINSYTLAISTILWLTGLALNSKAFYEVTDVRLWELILGILIIISSFTLVTPLKHIYFPETRVFGVLNGGVFIFGFFIIFYGVRRYKIIIPYGVMYGIFIVLNFLWNVLGNSVIGYNLAILSSKIAYEMLKLSGYQVSLYNTTITIISINGSPVSATVAGLCSGIEGITFSIVVLILLFMGSKISYKWRIITITIAAGIMIFLNIIRIYLIFISAYYYGQGGLQEAHAWLGTIMFLLFIIPYWYWIDKKLNVERDVKCDSSLSSN